MDTQLTIERPAPGAPPTAFRLWAFGAVALTHGVFEFSKRSAALLMKDQVERNVDYAFDYDHHSLRSDLPPELRGAAGFHRLEVRADGLWLVNCRWTDRAAKLIAAGEYRYHSPVFHADPETREIIAYVSCALTNSPATFDCLQVAASARGGKPIAGAAPPDPRRIAAALDIDRKSGIRTGERYQVLQTDGQFVLSATREQAIRNLPLRMQEAALSFTPRELQVTLHAVAAGRGGK